MLRLAVALTVGGLVAFVLAGSAPVSADDKNPTNEEIMKKLHGKTGEHKVIAEAVKSEPNWEEIARHAKRYADLTAALEKNKPDKGDEKSWKRLSHQYATDAKGLGEAAVKKDKDGVKEVLGKLKESCETCHENHQP